MFPYHGIGFYELAPDIPFKWIKVIEGQDCLNHKEFLFSFSLFWRPFCKGELFSGPGYKISALRFIR